jgi:hypothetical protein
VAHSQTDMTVKIVNVAHSQTDMTVKIVNVVHSQTDMTQFKSPLLVQLAACSFVLSIDFA